MALTSIHLHELAFIFGILGNIVSFGVYLAPLPTFWSIYKKKSTQGFQSIPYAVALFSAMLLLYYAFVKENNGTMIITINTIGCAIEGFYLTVYLIYAPRKARMYTVKLLGLFNVAFYGLIVLTTMAFVRGSDHHTMFSKGGDREKVVGWICAIFSVCVFAAPLSVMRMVIRTKSVEFMPFCLSFALTLCAIMWFFYGFLIHDFYIALPNILGFAFGITQMILYIMYKDSKNKQEDLGIKETNMKQLQDLAVDIKLGKVEMIQQDTTTIPTTEVVEIIVDDVANDAANSNNNNNNINEDVNVRRQVNNKNEKDEVAGGTINGENNVKAGELPRGESSV